MLRSPTDSQVLVSGGPRRLEDSKCGEGHEAKSAAEGQIWSFLSRHLAHVEMLRNTKRPSEYCPREVSGRMDMLCVCSDAVATSQVTTEHLLCGQYE